MIGHGIKRADHGAHTAGNAAPRFDQDDLREISGAMDGAGRAGGLARGRVAMAAFVGEGRGELQAGLGMDARPGGGLFEHSQE
jgi:hypothetical protein